MDLNYLKKLLKILDSSDISEIEIEEEGTKIKISKPDLNAGAAAYQQKLIQSGTNIPNITPVPEARESASSVVKKTEQSEDTENLFEVRSPMVGTFYRSPAPDADPYVNVGDVISNGSILCIIEAMKLMNEIESEVSGKVVKILVENSQPVEYNQPLFIIEIS